MRSSLFWAPPFRKKWLQKYRRNRRCFNELLSHSVSLGCVSVVGSVTQLAVSQEDHSSHQAGSYQGHDMPLPPADDVGRRRMGMDMRDMLND